MHLRRLCGAVQGLLAAHEILQLLGLMLFLLRRGARLLLLGYDRFHVAEFLFQSGKHLFRDLKLDGARVVLDREGVRAQILDQGLVLAVVVALAHLEHHVLVTFKLLAVCNRGWEEPIGSAGQVSYFRILSRRQEVGLRAQAIRIIQGSLFHSSRVNRVEFLLRPMLKVSPDFGAALFHRCALVCVLNYRVLIAVWPAKYLVRLADHLFSLVIDVHLPVLLAAVLRFITVAQPIVKVIPKLLQDVHMVANRTGPLILHKRPIILELVILAAPLILEEDPSSIGRCLRLTIIIHIVYVATLRVRHRVVGELTLHHFAAVGQRAQAVPSQGSLETDATQIVEAVGGTCLVEISCFIIVVAGYRCRGRHHLAFDQVCPSILLMFLICSFKVLECSALVDVLRIEAIKLFLSPLDQIVRVEERVLKSPSLSMVQLDLLLFGFAQALVVLVRSYFQFWDGLIDGQARVLLELRQLNVLLLELHDGTEKALHFLGRVPSLFLVKEILLYYW